MNNYLFTKKRLWVPYGDVADNAKINILLNKKAMRISIKGKTFMHGIALNELIGLFTPSEKYLSDGSWLLMDRETKADDNAEHFYRYMMQNHPEQTCYFVLNRTAPDWNRLEQEGFKLVEFGGSEYEQRLRKAEKNHFQSFRKTHQQLFWGFIRTQQKICLPSTWSHPKRPFCMVQY